MKHTFTIFFGDTFKTSETISFSINAFSTEDDEVESHAAIIISRMITFILICVENVYSF